jgi:hypothetical protein
MALTYRRAVAIGVLSATAALTACAGQVAAGLSRDASDTAADAAPEATSYPAACDAGCSDGYVPIHWWAHDGGGIAGCSCGLRDRLGCEQYFPDAPVWGPRGPVQCLCAICGPQVLQSFVCTYDPYYGDVVAVSCVE